SWPPTTRPAPNGPSTSRLTGCAAKSRAIRPIRSTCRRCAARDIYFTQTEEGPLPTPGTARESMLAPNERGRYRPAGWAALGRSLWERCVGVLADLAPKGLYARALIIIIAPIVLLESVVAFTFMERHWNQVTRRLSESTARNIG